MSEKRGVLRRIVWRDVFPGLILFHCFRLSIGLPVLFLATLGTLLMPIGPWLFRKAPVENAPVTAVISGLPPGMRAPSVPPNASQIPPVLPVPVTSTPSGWAPRGWVPLGLLRTYQALAEPFASVFNREASFGQMLSSLGVAAWYLLVWSFFGGAITRIAIVQLGRQERVTLDQSVRYVLPKFGWYISAPLFPLLGVALMVVPLLLLGLVMRVGIGLFLAGILWPLVLVAGLVMAVLVTELLFGWLLMWPTISAEEGSDSFQAFSNSFSFTFQRPLQYLAYAVIALLLGGLGGLFVEVFGQGVIWLNHWAVSFGSGRERLNDILLGRLDETWLGWAGSGLIGMWDRLVLVIVQAYYFSFLFCAASAIYLLLRREVDQTDFDEVYVPEDSGRYSLPPLRTGPHGVPEIDEPPPPAPTTEATSE